VSASRPLSIYFVASMLISVLSIAAIVLLFWLQNFGVLLALLAFPVVMVNGLVAAVWMAVRERCKRIVLAAAIAHGAGTVLSILGVVASLNAHIQF
jgi:hypothetical protein